MRRSRSSWRSAASDRPAGLTCVRNPSMAPAAAGMAARANSSSGATTRWAMRAASAGRSIRAVSNSRKICSKPRAIPRHGLPTCQSGQALG